MNPRPARIRNQHEPSRTAFGDEHSLTIDEALLCEQLVGLTMAGEVCARWLDSEEPDLEEVRKLVGQMVVVSRRALSSLRD